MTNRSSLSPFSGRIFFRLSKNKRRIWLHFFLPYSKTNPFPLSIWTFSFCLLSFPSPPTSSLSLTSPQQEIPGDGRLPPFMLDILSTGMSCFETSLPPSLLPIDLRALLPLEAKVPCPFSFIQIREILFRVPPRSSFV